MNMIRIVISIGLWVIAIEKGYNFFKMRDTNADAGDSAQRKELRALRNSFLWNLGFAVIYSYIVITKF